MKLESALEIAEEIFSTRAELDNLRETVPTSKLGDIPHGKATSSTVEIVTIKIEKLEQRLDELAAEYAETSARLTAEIFQRVSRKAGKVLFELYILGKTPTEIAADLNCSRAHVYKLHSQGKREFSSPTPPSPL